MKNKLNSLSLFIVLFTALNPPSKVVAESIYSPTTIVEIKDNNSGNSIDFIEEYKLDYSTSKNLTNSTITESYRLNKYVSQIPSVPSAPQQKPSAFSDLILNKPTSPAAKIIGIGTETIPTISTPKQFGFEVLNGLDNNGNFNTGITVDILPYVLIRGNDFTLEEYVNDNSGFQRFLANTTLSVATSRADDTARAAIGLEFVLLNEGDPRMDKQYSSDLLGIQQKILKKVQEEFKGTNATPDQLKEALKEAKPVIIKEIKTAAERRSAQKAIWTIAAANSWFSPTKSYADLRGEGMGFWTTYKTGIGGDSQLLLHASARNGERVTDRKGGFVNADTLVGGVRLQSGSETFRFSVETSYNRESQGGQRNNDYLYFGIGLEPRVFENSWLSLSFGGNTGRQNGTDLQLKTALKWDFNPGYVEKK